MNFYQFMSNKKYENPLLNDVFLIMSIDSKLFPSLDLPCMGVGEWRNRIMKKISDSETLAAFETAVEDFKI